MLGCTGALGRTAALMYLPLLTLLPPGNQVAFRDQPAMAPYWSQVVAAGILLIIQSFLVVQLLINRRMRLRAEDENASLMRMVEEQRKRLAEIVSDIPGIVWEAKVETGAPRKVQYISDYVGQMLGYSAEEWLSTPGFGRSIVLAEDREQVSRDVEAILANGGNGVVQYRWRAKDGRLLWAETHMRPMVNESGGMVGLSGVTLDITERKQTEDALRQSEERTRDLLRAIPDWMFLFSPDGIYLDYHARDVSNLCAPPEHFLGKNLRDVVRPELAEALLEKFRQARASGEMQVLEYWVPVRGEERWREARIVASGSNVLAVIRDVTNRRRAEQATRESEANYRSIFNAVNDAIFIHDTETGQIVDVNQVVCDMYKTTVEEARGLGPDALSSNEPPYTGTEALARLRKAVDGEPQLFEWRARDRTGRMFWVEVSLKRAVIGGNERVLAIVRDITDRRRAAEAVREGEARFRAMADSAPVMVWLSGLDKGCTYVNQQWLDFVGRSIDEEYGDGWTDSVHPDDLERCFGIYETAFDRREVFKMEYRLRRADGEYRWVYDSGAPRYSPGGRFLGYIGSAIDISERKAAEKGLQNLSGQLIRAREDECARIAREIHDDLNQRMAILSIELEQLALNPPDTEDALVNRLQELKNQTTEISREIHRISYDLHPSKLLHLGLVAALKGLCNELRKRHRMKIEFIDDGVPSDLPQDISLCLYRIVQECMSNVVRHSGAKQALVDLRVVGAEIKLRVEDAGVGFDLESPATTKGLGLISMRERLRLVGGVISIASRPSEGTRIDATVPLAQAEVEGNHPIGPRHAVGGSRAVNNHRKAV